MDYVVYSNRCTTLFASTGLDFFNARLGLLKSLKDKLLKGESRSSGGGQDI